jgi:hypothetical protein
MTQIGVTDPRVLSFRPGFGGREPLVIDGNLAYVEFHSDGSNEDWGWHFTVVPDIAKTAVGGAWVTMIRV